MRKKKITSEDIKQALENFNGNYIHFGTAAAEGARMNGSVCAARAGSSLMGRAQQRANYFKDMKSSEKMKKRKEFLSKKPRRRDASDAQLRYMDYLGISYKKGVSKFEARNSISQYLRVTKQMNKEIQKRIDLDE